MFLFSSLCISLSLSQKKKEKKSQSAFLQVSDLFEQLISRPSLNNGRYVCLLTQGIHRLIVIIMYIYHALINALSAHMIHINLNMIFYTHVEHSPYDAINTSNSAIFD